MNGKIAKIGLASVLMLISISVASAATITVNDDGGGIIRRYRMRLIVQVLAILLRSGTGLTTRMWM